MSEKPRKRKKIWFFLLAAVLLLTGLTLDSNLRLVTTEYTIAVENLPESFQGFRIAQLSDLHGKEFGADNTDLVEAVKAAAPDIIALTGDFVSAEADLAVTELLARQLTAIAPVYFASGNHDFASGHFAELVSALEAAGVKCLRNEAVMLRRDDGELVLAGVDDPNGPYDMLKPDEVVNIINNNHPSAPIILLAHRNDFIKKYPDLQVDIIFSGHAHGGVVRLPLLGGVLGTGFELFPDYTEGVHQSGHYSLVISRGLGNSAGLPRFLNNPELVVVTLA